MDIRKLKPIKLEQDKNSYTISEITDAIAKAFEIDGIYDDIKSSKQKTTTDLFLSLRKNVVREIERLGLTKTNINEEGIITYPRETVVYLVNDLEAYMTFYSFPSRGDESDHGERRRHYRELEHEAEERNQDTLRYMESGEYINDIVSAENADPTGILDTINKEVWERKVKMVVEYALRYLIKVDEDTLFSDVTSSYTRDETNLTPADMEADKRLQHNAYWKKR